MRFTDEKGTALGLIGAAARGCPEVPGSFAPTGDGDLRPAVYAPEASYTETAASALASLFPEDLDPLLAERLAARAFAEPPAIHGPDADILVLDYSSGPSGSGADMETALLAGILAGVARRGGPRLLLADGSGPEGEALSEAIDGVRDLSLVLLYPQGQAASGLRSQRLARQGGQVTLLSVRGDRGAVEGLIREAAGRSLAGMAVTAAGPANPARVAARIVSLATSFSLLRTGIAGDLYYGIRGGDGLGLAACLWAWRLGLPLTGIILSVGEKGVLGIEAAGRNLVDRFDADRPGVIRSLAMLEPVDRETALRSRAALEAAGGPALDLASAMTLAAAERSLDAGLRGHARIVVPLGALPRWDEASGPDASGDYPGGGLRDARVDAEIGPSLPELERALTAGGLFG
jgi:hypothetical protein